MVKSGILNNQFKPSLGQWMNNCLAVINLFNEQDMQVKQKHYRLNWPVLEIKLEKNKKEIR